MTAFSRTPDVAQRCLRATAGAALGIGLLLASGASFAAQAAHATVFDRAEFVLSSDPSPPSDAASTPRRDSRAPGRIRRSTSNGRSGDRAPRRPSDRYRWPRSLIASTTMLVPTAIIRMSDATRT